MSRDSRRKERANALKRMSPEEFEQWKEQNRLSHGAINPESRDPAALMSMARVLGTMFEDAKQSGTVDPAMEMFYTNVNTTIKGLADIPIACKKGCSHCCHTWVSVSPPEILYIAKHVKLQNTDTVQKVRAAHEQTKTFDFDTRDQHPYACPLLDQDVCTIYESRPMTCRLAASIDAEICGRTYHNISTENVPMPMMHMTGRSAYAFALTAGLRKAGLPYRTYEWNAGLSRALETEDAERRWLAGEDIFSGVLQESLDQFADPNVERMYDRTFTTT